MNKTYLLKANIFEQSVNMTEYGYNFECSNTMMMKMFLAAEGNNEPIIMKVISTKVQEERSRLNNVEIGEDDAKRRKPTKNLTRRQ